MLYPMTAGAAAAKKRQRGPTISEARQAKEAADQKAAGAQSSRPTAKPSACEDGVPSSTDGKARKTGMVLARAKLSATIGGVVAAQERANSLLGKGDVYRDAESLARQGPVGSLSTKDMPKRKDAKSATAKAKHGKGFRAWMTRALKSKVREKLVRHRTCVASGGMLIRLLACVRSRNRR